MSDLVDETGVLLLEVAVHTSKLGVLSLQVFDPEFLLLTAFRGGHPVTLEVLLTLGVVLLVLVTRSALFAPLLLLTSRFRDLLLGYLGMAVLAWWQYWRAG